MHCSVQRRQQATKFEQSGLVSILLFFLALLIVYMPSPTYAKYADFFDTSQDNWALLGGYSQAVPGWGDTRERVESLDIILRYKHIIIDNIGSGWYRGRHAILVEVPLSIVVNPETSSMIGVNFLASYTFTGDKAWQPYLFGGGGPVYSFADIPGMGAKLNGNYQFGLGLRYSGWGQQDLLFELRYHHISNAGSEEPNRPLNAWKVLLGITF